MFIREAYEKVRLHVSADIIDTKKHIEPQSKQKNKSIQALKEIKHNIYRYILIHTHLHELPIERSLYA